MRTGLAGFIGNQTYWIKGFFRAVFSATSETAVIIEPLAPAIRTVSTEQENRLLYTDKEIRSMSTTKKNRF